MGKQVTKILKKLGYDISAQQVPAPESYRSKLKTPAERERQEKENLEREKRRQAWLKIEQERIEKEHEVARKRQEEYDRPVPEFATKVARGTRVRLLQYVAKVFDDAARKVLQKDFESGMGAWEYKDRPVQEFSVAIRIAELKPVAGSSHVDQAGTLIVWHACPADNLGTRALAHREEIQKRVAYRIENNLLKPENMPIFEPILGKDFSVQVQWPDLDELKKSGFKFDPQEERVTHLEIF